MNLHIPYHKILKISYRYLFLSSLGDLLFSRLFPFRIRSFTLELGLAEDAVVTALDVVAVFERLGLFGFREILEDVS